MDIPEAVQRVLAQFLIPSSKLEEIRDSMAREFSLGLSVGTPAASVPMLLSFVPALPDGSEQGKYLSLDLSGKNLRVMLLNLTGRNQEPQVISETFLLHQEVMTGTADELFNFIVNKLAKFLTEHGLLEADLPLGFVFSYPTDMTGIRNARLLWWTKGFNVPDCLNQDVGQMLEDALRRHGTIKVKVKAIMNDTVGQLAAAAYKHGPDCQIGVVVGYGCNAAYLEDVSNIKKFKAQNAGYKFPKIVIDTEWEEFGQRGELDDIRTQFDKDIDDNSVHRGKQLIDKLTGAFFLGDVVRRILDGLAEENVLFGGIKPDFLATPDTFPSKFIPEILSDDNDATLPFKNIRRIMDELRVPVHGTMEYISIKEICHAVSLRSASIVAAAIAALMKVINRPKIIVGVGGALIQYHPTYRDMLRDKLDELVPSSVVEWDVVLAEDGSAKGAALIAATVENLHL